MTFFEEPLRPKDLNSCKAWSETIEKLNRIEKIPYEIISLVVKEVREDKFWRANFLSITKLRRKNPDGVMYVQAFYEKFKDKINGKTKKSGAKNATEYFRNL